MAVKNLGRQQGSSRSRKSQATVQAGASPKPGKVAKGEDPVSPRRGAGGRTLLRKRQGKSRSHEQQAATQPAPSQEPSLC